MEKIKLIKRFKNYGEKILHNIEWGQILNSRVSLIDSEITSLERRIERIKINDDFLTDIHTADHRPVAINEKQNPIYPPV
jgi:hypothetical protein